MNYKERINFSCISTILSLETFISHSTDLLELNIKHTINSTEAVAQLLNENFHLLFLNVIKL